MMKSDYLILALVNFLVNFSIAAIAVLFAFWKFRMEKWWDKRFQCYMDTIDAINCAIKISDEIIQFNNREKVLNKVVRKKLDEEFNLCKMRLGGIATVGELLLSKQAHNLIWKFDAMLYDFDIGNADEQAIAVIRDDAEAYLTQFVKFSKVDLHKNFLKF